MIHHMRTNRVWIAIIEFTAIRSQQNVYKY